MTITIAPGPPPHINAILDVIRSSAPGSVVTYVSLDAVAGCPRRRWQGSMRAVKKVLLEAHRIGLELVPRVGYLHVADCEIDRVTSRGVRKVYRKTRDLRHRAVHGLKSYESLSDKEKINYTAQVARLGFLELASAPKVEQRIREVVARGGVPRPPEIAEISQILSASKKR